MTNLPTDAIGEEITGLATKLKQNLEAHLANPDKDEYADRIKTLRAEIEARGYTVAILAHTDERGVPNRIRLAVVRDGSTPTRH